MHIRFFFGMGLLVGFIAAVPSTSAEASAARDRRCTSDKLAFGALTETERRRFQARYRTRVRVHGQNTAERFLFEQVCLTVEERKALRPPRKNQGKNCRAVSTPVTSMDGSMTVGIKQVCD